LMLVSMPKSGTNNGFRIFKQLSMHFGKRFT